MNNINGDSRPGNGLDLGVGATFGPGKGAATRSRKPYLKPQVRLMEMSSTKATAQGASTDATTANQAS